ncbi:sporulation protein YqfD [Faecalispora anaeroviscerum]|uniref:sporulation protein YqfD n=1 Tax=Faecalispora anaeroviscerum TaxID=2991836 RepID=UPI0024B8BEB6|nr:sporulation protein YqfD [Faecalispora anaeroviscerum]
MGSIAFVRWILGWVEFQIYPRRKGACERFLNLCARQGVALWRIGRAENFFTASIVVGRYEELRPIARKARVRLKAGERHGLPFLWKKVSARKGLLVGLALFAFTLHVFSMYVWSVQVTGNTSIPGDKIIAEAKNLGLSPGALKSRLEYQELQRRLMIAFPDVSWLSVNTQGCTVEIALEEQIKHPEAENQEKISNLKASASGQILKLEVTGGVLQVKVGDAVVKGQLLVSGVADNTFGGTRMMRSSGRIIAETEKSLVVEIPMKQTVLRPTGKQIVRRSVRIFGLELPLSLTGRPQGEYQKASQRVTLKGKTGDLPISVYTETWSEQSREQVTLTEAQAEAQANVKMEELKQQEWKDVKILSSNLSGKIDGSVYRMTLYCQCEENIALESEILFKP